MPPMTIDTGNTAFMLLCSSLVMLMTPGLAFFYGGLVGRKNVLAIMIQSFVSMGWTTVLWWAFGFRSEEHTSELQSQSNLVCRLLLEKKKTTYQETYVFLS